ncbi:30S ribosomal protein S4 [Leucobacter sp. GX24907]
MTRQSRALGLALTPKAARYLEKRPYGPGQHGRTKRRSDSDYAVRLREKQRLRAQYGLREKQLTIVFNEARRQDGLTGENLVELLEMRLDALVLRAGFARTTAQARQLVVHRHILVDGKLVDRPSFRVKPGQLIHVKERSEGLEPFQVAAAGGHAEVLPNVPGYLEVELDKLQARLLRRPKRAEVPVTCEVQLVVEYYSGR